MRPRVGFRPTSPHHAAGPLIEPPASVACATGTMPDATAAAEPPLEIPAIRSRSQGFRIAPVATVSAEQEVPSSEQFALPSMMKPAPLVAPDDLAVVLAGEAFKITAAILGWYAGEKDASVL